MIAVREMAKIPYREKDVRAMKKNIERMLAYILVFAMVMGLIPVPMADVRAEGEAAPASATDATSVNDWQYYDSKDSITDKVQKSLADEGERVESASEEGKNPEDLNDVAEDETEEEPQDVAFNAETECEGFTIKVEADPGVFPEGSTLKASKVSDTVAEAEGVYDAVGDTRSDDINVAAKSTFDITVYDAEGNEIEPNNEKGEVRVTFTNPLIADSNLDTNVYHIKDDNDEMVAEKLDKDESGEAIEVTTDGFSYYTVEFTYGEKMYIMNGDTTIPLSDILSYVGLTGEVSDVSVSNEELFSASNGEDGWVVTAHQAFTTTEWMNVTIDGIIYDIVVTDDTQWSIDKSNPYTPTEYSNSYVGYYTRTDGFDVQGAGGIKTTFSSGGYKTELLVDGDQHRLSGFGYGYIYTLNGIKVRVTPSLPSGSKAVIINYEIENSNLVKKQIKIGSWADVQIGSDDYAALNLSNNGLTMNGSDGNIFTLVPGGGNFTTHWMGQYSYAERNVFTNNNAYDTCGNTSRPNDSGLAWSWTIDLQPGEKVTKTAVLGAGEIQMWTLTFFANGGTGTMSPQTYVGGVSTGLPKNEFKSTNTNKPDFMGWAESPNATVNDIKYYDKDNITLNTDKELYAVWGLKNKQTVHIDFPNVIMTCGDNNKYVEAHADGGGDLSYQVTSGSDVISINYTTGKITAIKPGTATVEVTAAETNTHKKGTASATVTVNKIPASIKYATTTINKTYGDANFTNAITNSADGSVSYSSSNTNVATVASNGQVTIKGAGTATITATASDSSFYTYTGSNKTATYTLNVGIATPTISTLPTASAITYGQSLANSSLTNGVAKAGTLTVPGTFTWKASSTKPSVSDSQSTQYDVVFTPSNTTNCKSVECKVKLTVNKANPTVTAPTAKSLTYNGSEQVLVNAGSTTGGTLQYAIGTSASSAPTSGWGTGIPSKTNAGTYYVWYKVVGGANYNDVSAKCVTVTIAKKEIGIVWSNTVFTYDAKSHVPTATATGLIGTDSCTITVTGAKIDAGTYTATASAVSNNNYKLPAAVTTSLVILKKDISSATVILGPTHTYDGSVKTQTINSVVVDGLNVTYNVAKNTNTGKNAGDYTITIIGTGNFEGSKDVDWTIKKADLNVVVTPYSAKYDGQSHGIYVSANGGSEITYSMLESGPYTIYNPTFKDVNPADGGNYTVYYKVEKDNYNTVTGHSTVTILKRNITLTSATDEKVYDSEALTNDTVTVTGDGFVTGEGASYDVTGTQTGAGQSDNSFTYTLNENTFAINYDINVVFGKLTVHKANPVVAVNGKTDLVYTGLNQELVTGEVEGGILYYALGEDDTTVPTEDKWSEIIPEGKDAKDYFVWYKVTGDPNHNDAAPVCETVNIEQAPVTVAADSATKIYGDEDPELTAQVTGMQNDESIELIVYSIARAEGENVGEYTITPAGDASQGNYSVTYVTKTFTITRAPLTIAADEQTKIYGEEDPELTVTITGFKRDDTREDLVDQGALVWSINREGDGTVVDEEENQNVGEYIITPAGDEEQGNYFVTYKTSTLTITPATLRIAADIQTKVYGEDDPVFTYVVNEEDLRYADTEESIITGILTRDINVAIDEGVDIAGEYLEKREDVGIYTIMLGTLSAGDNYVIDYTENTLEITKRPITITADDKEKYYGEEDPELTFTLSEETPLVYEDTIDAVEISLVREEGEKFGEYVITASDIQSENYEVTFEDGTFTILKVETAGDTDVIADEDAVQSIDVATDMDEVLDELLSEEDRQMIEDGAGIRVYFEISKQAPVKPEEKPIIEEALPMGFQMGVNYDISLFKKYSFKEEPDQIHEIPNAVMFEFNTGYGLPEVPEGATREFEIIRVHDGEAQVIPSEYDAEKHVVKFKSDRFSTYTLAYKDVMKKTDVKSVIHGVKTGDPISMALVLTLMTVSAFGIGNILYRKRKNNLSR